MKIQSSNTNTISTGKSPDKRPNTWNKIKNGVIKKIYDATPSATFNIDKQLMERLKKIDERISRPAENRLIMGATALVTQPTIDYHNTKVDEETREISRNRTIAKVLAGTSVGILVRGSSYELVKKMTDIEGKSKNSTSLIPKGYLREFKQNGKFLANYRSALSTGLAIAAMCITNFLIDAPLTVYLTNKFNEKSKLRQKKEVIND